MNLYPVVVSINLTAGTITKNQTIHLSALEAGMVKVGQENPPHRVSTSLGLSDKHMGSGISAMTTVTIGFEDLVAIDEYAELATSLCRKYLSEAVEQAKDEWDTFVEANS